MIQLTVAITSVVDEVIHVPDVPYSGDGDADFTQSWWKLVEISRVALSGQRGESFAGEDCHGRHGHEDHQRRAHHFRAVSKNIIQRSSSNT